MNQVKQNYFSICKKILKSSCAVMALWGIIFSLFSFCPFEMTSAKIRTSDTLAQASSYVVTTEEDHSRHHCGFENNKQAARISLQTLECISKVEKISRIQLNALIKNFFDRNSLELSKLDSESTLLSLRSSSDFSAYMSIHAIRTVVIIV